MPEIDNTLNNALIVFSKQHRWAFHLVEKLSYQYNVTTMVASPIFFRGGTRSVESKLNSLIEKNKIGIVFLDAEFFPIVDSLVINQIPDGVLRVLLAFDDILQHETNLQHALSCHAVLTADPISVYRFRQRAIPAHLICLEGSANLYYPANEGAIPRYDVLFFGDPHRGDRPKWLTFLAENGVEVFMPTNGSLSYEELAEKIRSSRIVLNFSKVGTAPYSPLANDVKAPYVYFKGRIVEAGLSRVPCLSETFPGAEEMFEEGVLPCFSTPEECLQLIQLLLKDEAKRISLGKALYEHCSRHYADIPQSRSIADFLTNCPDQKLLKISAGAFYCATLLSRKIFRLLPYSPGLALKEIYRLASHRLLKGGFLTNLLMVSSLTIVTAFGIFFNFFASRFPKAEVSRFTKIFS